MQIDLLFLIILRLYEAHNNRFLRTKVNEKYQKILYRLQMYLKLASHKHIFHQFFQYIFAQLIFRAVLIFAHLCCAKISTAQKLVHLR